MGISKFLYVFVLRLRRFLGVSPESVERREGKNVNVSKYLVHIQATVEQSDHCVVVLQSVQLFVLTYFRPRSSNS